MRDQLAARAHEVLHLSTSSFDMGLAPWQYTGNLLQKYYERLEQPELKSLIRSQYSYYWRSPIMTQWIPWCIKNTTGSLAFASLLSKGAFTRAPLRRSDESLPQLSEMLPSPELAAESAPDLITEGRLIPSLDVFLWSLAVAGIRHYGNDRGFFARLSMFCSEPSIANLQLTGAKEDCRRFINLDQDYGILLDIDEPSQARVALRVSSPSKLTRISSFGSAFVLAGDALITLLARYRRGEFSEINLSLQES
jgi:hypothetical protein